MFLFFCFWGVICFVFPVSLGWVGRVGLDRKDVNVTDRGLKGVYVCERVWSRRYDKNKTETTNGWWDSFFFFFFFISFLVLQFCSGSYSEPKLDSAKKKKQLLSHFIFYMKENTLSWTIQKLCLFVFIWIVVFSLLWMLPNRLPLEPTVYTFYTDVNYSICWTWRSKQRNL